MRGPLINGTIGFVTVILTSLPLVAVSVSAQETPTCEPFERLRPALQPSQASGAVQSIPLARALNRWRLAPEGNRPYDAEPFFRVTSGFFTDDGRLVIANAGTSEVLIIGRDGAVDSRFGRSGQGPAEFTLLYFIHFLPWTQSIVAVDGGSGFLKEFSLNGQLIRTIPALGLTGTRPYDAFPLPDGRFIVQQQPVFVGRNAARNTLERVALLLSLDPSTGANREILAIQGADQVRTNLESGGYSVLTPPFATIPWVMVHSACLLVPTEREPILSLLTSEGEPLLRVTLPFLDLTLTEDRWSARLDRVRSDAHGAAVELIKPERRPAWSAGQFDGATRLWLEDYHHRDEPVSGWWIVELDEGTASFLPAPSGAYRLLAVTPDRAAIVHRNDLDVESVLLYRLAQP